MTTIIHTQGVAEFSVPDAQKVAVFSADPCKVYYQVGYPNYPSVWKLLATTSAGTEYLSAAFSGATNVRVEAGASEAYYEVGAAPVTNAPQTDLTGGADPWVLAGVAGTQGGKAQLKGGTSSTAGNAGGAANLTGGQPGATGVGGAANVTGAAGGATSGTGGAANVTGGAGTNGNASGGSVVLTGGAKNGTGVNGGIRMESLIVRKQGAPTAKTVSATLTAAELLAGIITVNQAAAGASALQVPTGTAIQNALPTDFGVDDSFDVSVINTSVVDAEDASVTVNTDVTLVGSMDFLAYNAAGVRSSGIIRFRKTADHVFVGYRIA